MEGDDLETWVAYYCFVNRNILPSQFNNLSFREKALITAFVKREAQARDKETKKTRQAGHGRRKGGRR